MTAGLLQFGGGPYSPGVIAAGLEAVWNMKGGAGVGARKAANKTLGVDALPSGTTYSGGVLAITASCSFGDSSGTGDSWDFSPATVAIVVEGNSTVVAMWDVHFAPHNNSATPIYGIEVSDNSTTPTVNLHYCTFDGLKISQGNAVGTFGPWGAALYVNAGATVTTDHCWFKGCSYDVVKVTNASYTETNCLKNSYGWDYNNADADGIQAISGTYSVSDCLYDMSDGNLASNPPMNSALFCTIDTTSTGNGTPNVQNTIFYGYGLFIHPGIPFTVLSVADNHTAETNGFNIVNGVWQNNVVQPGSSGYWTNGGTETSSQSIASWAGNVDYATGITIPAPSF